MQSIRIDSQIKAASTVNTENLTWYLINAVKELNAKVTALENK